jgi:hypothetical protein
MQYELCARNEHVCVQGEGNTVFSHVSHAHQIYIYFFNPPLRRCSPLESSAVEWDWNDSWLALAAPVSSITKK